MRKSAIRLTTLYLKKCRKELVNDEHNSGISIQPLLRCCLAAQQIIIPGMPQYVMAMEDIITDILPEEDEVKMTVMKNGSFTEEDIEIMNCYLKFRTKLDKIATIVEGRTAAAIKNRLTKHIRNNFG